MSFPNGCIEVVTNHYGWEFGIFLDVKRESDVYDLPGLFLFVNKHMPGSSIYLRKIEEGQVFIAEVFSYDRIGPWHIK